MIRSFNDHAANERTFLAWVRTGLSAIALGIVVKKGSLFALMIASASSPVISSTAQDYLSGIGGSALVGIGIAMIGGAAVRLVRTTLRIDDQVMHSAGIVRLTSALSRRKRAVSEAVERVSTNPGSMSASKNKLSLRSGRVKLRLVGGTEAGEIELGNIRLRRR